MKAETMHVYEYFTEWISIYVQYLCLVNVQTAFRVSRVVIDFLYHTFTCIPNNMYTINCFVF